jgi:hypothetical protein
MRRSIALTAVALAALAALLLGWACGNGPEPLAFRLEQPTDLPRPPTAAAPGLTSDLVPPGYR